MRGVTQETVSPGAMVDTNGTIAMIMQIITSIIVELFPIELKEIIFHNDSCNSSGDLLQIRSSKFSNTQEALRFIEQTFPCF
eukprot:m.140423 g.140423  ORF g.140423 m.140423 type:complete len:82 (-) comp30030_c0_seq1:2-247(-)